MAIIDKLLNRNVEKGKVTDSQKRMKKISTLKQSELEVIAAGSDDNKIRCEAVMHLDFGSTLISIAFDETSPATGRSGRQRIADLIDSEKVTLDQFQQATNLDQQLAVAALLATAGMQQQILNKIGDQATLLDVAKNSSSATIRSWAADQLTNEEMQNELLKYSKGKDKTVYKLVKAKLDKLQSQHKQQQAVREKINELIEAAERHSKSPYDNLYQAKKDHLKQLWSELENVAEEGERTKVNDYFTICSQTVAAVQVQKPIENMSRASEELVPEVMPETLPESVPVDIDPEKVQQQRSELLDGCRKVLRALILDSEDISRSHTELNSMHIEGRWNQLLAQVAATESETSLFDKMRKLIIKELDLTESHGSIKKHFDQLLNTRLETDSHQLAIQEKSIAVLKKRFQLVNDLGEEFSVGLQDQFQAFEQWLKQRKQHLDHQQTVLRQLGGLLRKSRMALQIGKTAQAQGIRTSLEEKCQRLEQVPKHIQKQIEELDEQLNKVKDWKEYATLPKKEELLVQMQALVGINENPEALATKIKRLQEEWKLLSRGGFTDDGGLWEAFREAADLAYQPCAVFFEQQAKHRAENLQKRVALVKQLQDYDAQQDWDKPDWRQVAKLVQVAFNEWRSYQPVERSANKPVQENFDRIIGSIRDKLDHEHRNNKDAKKALIEQAKALVEAEDNHKAIEDVKLLQNRWKQLGSASHKSDQSLWKQFRKHCDAVFDKRKQLSTEFKAELNENKNKVVALCEELEQLGQKTLAELLESRDRVAEIRSAYNEIGSLPKAQASELQQRFRQCVDSYERRIVDEKAKAKAGAWDSMLSAYQLIREYQLSIVSNGDNETLKHQAEEAVNAEGEWPKGSQSILKKLLSATPNVDVDSNERRLLCIRAEILADLETPVDDQGLRMEYQVQQLAKGFGQGGQQFKNGREALQALLLEWIELKPNATENYNSLIERMNKCRKKIGV